MVKKDETIRASIRNVPFAVAVSFAMEVRFVVLIAIEVRFITLYAIEVTIDVAFCSSAVSLLLFNNA